jgi:predicted Rossmann fold flavoprotein
MNHANYEVVVIGAGAAGLMAAIHAAERGRRVLLLEKNRKPGVKILMSGGTRCNITHACDNQGIVEAFGKQGRFLHAPLAALGVQEVIEFFQAEGVAVKTEPTGKIFPVSDRALDVLNALLARLRRSGATLALSEPVVALARDPASGGFRVQTPARSLVVPKVIVTTGGLSYPGCGTVGDGYAFARHFGHTIVPTRPALVPVTVQADWVADLRGITIPDTGVRVVEADRHDRALAAQRGSLLFAHFGLSGPVVLDVSRAISGHATPHQLRLELDLLPTVNEAECDDWLRHEQSLGGKRQLAALLAERLPRRLGELLLAQAQVPADRRVASLTRGERSRTVQACKRLPVPVKGTLGYEKAEVTAGGVALDEVDSRTMQSKLAPGLFFAGEVLDLDGPIGGFNFQAAWSTGWLAGRSV